MCRLQGKGGKQSLNEFKIYLCSRKSGSRIQFTTGGEEIARKVGNNFSE